MNNEQVLMTVAEQIAAAKVHIEAVTLDIQPIADESARIRAEARALDAAWRALDEEYYRRMRDALRPLEEANRLAERTLGPWTEQTRGGWVRYRLRTPPLDIGKQARNEAWVRLYKETLGSDDKPMLDYPGPVEPPWGSAPIVLAPLNGDGPKQWKADADRILVANGWNLENNPPVDGEQNP